MWFFSNPRDVALSFSMDGFGPFKWHSKTVWPLIIFNYNIPAISMIMHMKGHNGISPCHMCNIQGIHIPSSWITTHYVPLNHDHFSGVNPGYQTHSLLLRNHDTFLKQAVEVQTALTTTALERLATSMESRVYLFSLL
jgi:Transposase family tnp2